jgi:tetraacyldisaccharide 4'-kinase
MLFNTIDIYKFWQKNNILNLLLQTLSYLWIFASFIRKIITKSYESKKFIICVGNINLGGAGKTPTCIHIAENLNKLGYKVCFLSSGYGGNFSNTQLINSTMDAKICGDEPLLLNQIAPTFISKSLKNGIKFIEENHHEFEMIILDDRYQNPQVIKNFHILVVNGKYGFGNGLIFPSGPLRESIKSGLNKANAILILEEDSYNIKALINDYYPQINNNIIYNGVYISDNLDNIKGNYLAFCGIAMPEKFINTLTKYDICVKDTMFFKDHHNYGENDIQNILTRANKQSLQIITTTKDYIKIDKKYKNTIQYLQIKLQLTNDNLINNIIKNYNIHANKHI